MAIRVTHRELRLARRTGNRGGERILGLRRCRSQRTGNQCQQQRRTYLYCDGHVLSPAMIRMRGGGILPLPAPRETHHQRMGRPALFPWRRSHRLMHPPRRSCKHAGPPSHRCDCPPNPHNAPMSLITLLNAHIAFGERPLLDGAQLTVQAGERLGLIGRNGTGKSTLLSVLAGSTVLDEGELQRREGLRLGLVEQEPELPAAETLHGSLLRRAQAHGAPADEREHWRLESRLEEFLHRFGVAGLISPASCSGGERKRAALALALALQPDLLLLDEPTNHLDIEAIERLEELLLKVPAAIVITHDRTFLDRITNRIIELDRGILRSYPGSFAVYEERKDEELAAEDTARRRFEKFWQHEEVWIRKGIEARRTRNEGRVRRLERLRGERATRRDRLGNIHLSLDSGERSGDLVADLDTVTKRFGARPVIERLSL